MYRAAGGVAKEGDLMTPRVFRRVLIRLAVVAIVAGSIVGVGGARGQVGDEPEPTVAVRPAASEPKAKEKPMDTAAVTVERGPGTTSRLSLPEQNTVTRECGSGRGADTKLGLLERSSVHGHCSP
jgi:hypothetical protein